MSDFATVRIRVPYRADVFYRNERRDLNVDESFEIPIAAISRADARVVAKIRNSTGGEEETIDFRSLDGCLFRPFLVERERGLWTPDRCREDPPTIGLDDTWTPAGALKTTLLGSRFRPSYIDATNGERRRAHKASPQAYADAGQRLEALAGRGLRLIDGVLFQETRAPGWACAVESTYPTRLVRACMPDLISRAPVTFVDPQYPADNVERAYAGRVHGPRTSSIEVIEPSLLPETVEGDALASFCIRLYTNLCGHRIGECERRYFVDALLLVELVERSLRQDLPLAPCYEAIERLAAWNRDDHQPLTDLERLTSLLARDAKTFLEMRTAFPPDLLAEPSQDEVDEVADAFRP